MAFEPGRHLVQVVSHVLGKSSTGTPHIAVVFEDINNDRITWYGYLTDAALARTIESLGILGWDPHAHDGKIDSLNGTGLLVGAEAEIVVEMETYEGKTNPKVKWVNEIGGRLNSMDDHEATAFAADLRRKILSAPKPKVVSQPGKADAVPATAGGADVDPADDLPF